jgi:hypothetical protein
VSAGYLRCRGVRYQAVHSRPAPLTAPPLVVTAVGLGAVAFLMKSDVRQSSAMLRRNLRHVRTWLEEQGAAAEYVVFCPGCLPKACALSCVLVFSGNCVVRY